MNVFPWQIQCEMSEKELFFLPKIKMGMYVVPAVLWL